jgi:pimeloyl-ACP methyl ester carboxylesterase
MLAMLRFDATAILPSIPIPTLVVAGDKDDTCRPEASQHMANTIPAAKLVTLAPAKHCGLFEHYHHFHLAVQNFLNVDAHLRGQSASGHKTITLGVENTVMKE